MEEEPWNLTEEDDLSSPTCSSDATDFPFDACCTFKEQTPLPAEFVHELLSSSPICFDSNSNPNSPQLTNISLQLFHKPRGSKGAWVKVEPGEKIRVAKEKGKKLKMEIDLQSFNVEFDKSNIKILLNDGSGQTIHQGQDPNVFSLDSLIWNGNRVEMEVKLFRMSKSLRFSIQVHTKDGSDLLTSHSVEFSTHNSGNSGKPKNGMDGNPENQASYAKLVPTDKKRKMEDDYKPSPPPMMVVPSMPKFEPMDNFSDELVTTIPGSLEVNGRVRARLFAQFSDVRLKVNITDIVDALETVTKLQGKTYEWNRETCTTVSTVAGEPESSRKVIGLIAQEVYEVLPEVVHKDPTTGLLSVSYTDLIPVLIEAFKQFLKEYEQDQSGMRTQLDDLKGKLEILSGKVDKELETPNLLKALSDLKIATRIFVEQSSTYAATMLEKEVTGIKKATTDFLGSISTGVYDRFSFMRYGEYTSGMYEKISDMKTGISNGMSSKISTAKSRLWNIPAFGGKHG